MKPVALFLRAALTVALLSASQLLLLAHLNGEILKVVVLLVLSLALVYWLLKPPVLLGVFAGVISVFLLLFMEQSALRLSEIWISAEPALAVFVGMDDTKTNTVAQVPEAFVPLPQNENTPASDILLREEPYHFADMYMERRLWMEGLSPLERQRCCEEAAAFLIEEGFADDDYSVAAIQTVDQVNLIELVSFFNVLLSDQNTDVSLDLTLDQLVGIALTDNDIEMLTVFVGLCVRRDIDRVMAIAREEVQALHGESEFAATVLLAMVQAGTEYPIDLLLSEQQRFGPLTKSRINQLASNHWNRVGRRPKFVDKIEDVASVKDQFSVELKEPLVENKPQRGPEQKVAAVPQSAPVQEPEPFLKITTHLGVVYISDDDELMHEWIAAANNLKIRGYVALGSEIVILRTDGVMLRKDQEWLHEMKGYIYHFKLEDIQRGMVTIRASGRELIR